MNASRLNRIQADGRYSIYTHTPQGWKVKVTWVIDYIMYQNGLPVPRSIQVLTTWYQLPDR